MRSAFLIVAIFFFPAAIFHSCNPEVHSGFSTPGQVCSGVNIHFTAGHEKDLDMIAAAGHKYIRMDFVWHNVERTKGAYDWTAYDELTSNLAERGLRALYILDYSNSLYEDTVQSSDPITGEGRRGIAAPCHPESVAAFARWSAAAAERYRKSNIVWEIWNEPNISFWMPEANVDHYNILARAVCEAIREKVPEAVIIGPATSQIPLPFIEAFLASGILEYLDGVSVHPYRDYAKAPESVIADYKILRGLIERYAPETRKDIPVISSEWGYASATKGLPLERQAEYAVRMQLANLLGGIPLSIWYDWKNDGDSPGNFEHNCGTVTSGLEPKPAYTALFTMNQQLKGYTLSERIGLENDNDYVLAFRNKKGGIKLAAWTSDTTHTVSLEIQFPESPVVTISDGYGNTLNPKVEESGLILKLESLPKYVELPEGSGWR